MSETTEEISTHKHPVHVSTFVYGTVLSHTVVRVYDNGDHQQLVSEMLDDHVASVSKKVGYEVARGDLHWHRGYNPSTATFYLSPVRV